MVNKNIGEQILSHYEKYLGNYADASVFAGTKESYPIQALKFANVQDGLKTFATLGFSKYADEVKNNAEIVFSVDENLEDTLLTIIMNALFFITENQIDFGKGSFIKGIEKINADFANSHNIRAVYFTVPFVFPEDFSEIEDEIKIYEAFFITQSELEYLEKNGAESFEDYLEENEIDVFDINRAVRN